MPFLAADAQGESARSQWLIRLRWVAVGGVLAVVTTSGPILDLVEHTAPLYALTCLLGLWNLVLHLRERRGGSPWPASRQVICDLFVLGGLLYFSGGLRNPFAVFLAVQAILASVLLPRDRAVRMGGLGVSLVLLLTMLDLLELVPRVFTGWQQGHPAELGAVGLWGAALALVITLGVAVFFTTQIMEDLRSRARELQRTHERVALERRNLRSVVRSMGAGLIILDRDLQVSWSNRLAAGLLERCATRDPPLLGGDWLSRPALERGETIAREWAGQDAWGRRRRFEISVAPARDAKGGLEQVIVLIVDVTERRAALEQLQMTEKLAALGRLAAGVAHEISTPLASVSILASEALAALPQARQEATRDQIAEYLRDVGNETDRISRLVRKLLNLGHPDEDTPEPAHVADVVREAVHLVSVRDDEGRFRVTALGDPDFTVEMGRDRLLQVLLNVLQNAVDASGDCQSPIDINVTLTESAREIHVEDRGCGIAPDDIPRVFDPFFTTKDVGEGTGLGLYVSYEIMRHLGGSISVAARDGGGTAVRIVLPGAPQAVAERISRP